MLVSMLAGAMISMDSKSFWASYRRIQRHSTLHQNVLHNWPSSCFRVQLADAYGRAVHIASNDIIAS